MITLRPARVIALAACSSFVALTACDSFQAADLKPFPSIERLEIGMTRDEVISLIGPPLIPRDLGGDFLPICDTFIYDQFQDALFLHIFYINGLVSEISDRNTGVCAIG